MTLTEIKKWAYGFFVMEETIKKTNFSSKKVWDYFNVERCMHIWDRIDWSFVLGHIDTTWTIKNLVLCEDKSQIMHINFPNKFKNLLIEKWSIAVNWVSLTLVDVSNEIFSISLIPYTLENTNLWDLQIWNLVNLEFDLIWKYIVKMHS